MGNGNLRFLQLLHFAPRVGSSPCLLWFQHLKRQIGHMMQPLNVSELQGEPEKPPSVLIPWEKRSVLGLLGEGVQVQMACRRRHDTLLRIIFFLTIYNLYFSCCLQNPTPGPVATSLCLHLVPGNEHSLTVKTLAKLPSRKMRVILKSCKRLLFLRSCVFPAVSRPNHPPISSLYLFLL